jgi:uncharacterized cupin superfamily protein
MSTIEAPYAVERPDARGYEPFMVDGVQVGEYHQLGTEGAAADTLDAGLWRSEPATYDYFFATDETFYVFEGAVTIELPDRGEKLELRAGDIAYFKAGTPSTWVVTEPFKKFVIVPA